MSLTSKVDFQGQIEKDVPMFNACQNSTTAISIQSDTAYHNRCVSNRHVDRRKLRMRLDLSKPDIEQIEIAKQQRQSVIMIKAQECASFRKKSICEKLWQRREVVTRTISRILDPRRLKICYKMAGQCDNTKTSREDDEIPAFPEENNELVVLERLLMAAAESPTAWWEDKHSSNVRSPEQG